MTSPWIAISIWIYSSTAGEGIQAWGAVNARAATTRDQRGAWPLLYHLRRNREKGKREQIHMEVVCRIANVSYNSNAGRISLQLQGVWLAEFHSGFPQSCPCCDWRENKFRSDELRREKLGIPMLFFRVQKHGSMYAIDSLCYSEFCYYEQHRVLFRNPTFHHPLSDELLGDFLSHFPVFLPSINSIQALPLASCVISGNIIIFFPFLLFLPYHISLTDFKYKGQGLPL